MMLVVHQDQLVALLCIGQADAAGVGRIGDPADSAAGCEIGVGQIEQFRKLLGRQAANSKGHGILHFPM
jgi:hypothetical protein